MNPLLAQTDAYAFAKQNLESDALIVLDVIENAITDGPPDYGWDKRTTYPSGVVAVAAGGLTVSYRPIPGGRFLMILVEDENAPTPWP